MDGAEDHYVEQNKSDGDKYSVFPRVGSLYFTSTGVRISAHTYVDVKRSEGRKERERVT